MKFLAHRNIQRKLSTASAIMLLLICGCSAPPPEIGSIPPDFTAQIHQTGGTIRLSDLRGKVVLLDFWASWSPPSVTSRPRLKKTYDAYHDKGLVMIGVALEYQAKFLDEFLAEHPLPWPQIVDEKIWSGGIPKRYGVTILPLTALIDREGKLVGWDLRGAELNRAIENAL